MGKNATESDLMGRVCASFVDFIGCCNAGYVTGSAVALEHMDVLEGYLNDYLGRLGILSTGERITITTTNAGE